MDEGVGVDTSIGFHVLTDIILQNIILPTRKTIQ